MGFHDAIALVRPRQWTKNLALFAAIIFAGDLFDLRLLGEVALAFVAFTLVTAGVYALNDAVDVERDREHPVKRERPVASGRVPKSHAYALGAAGIALGLALSAALSMHFFAAAAAYLALQAFYALALKRLAIVDMLVIAAGFVIRAVAGALVISVPVSPWLVLCTALLALFLAAAKRRHELRLLQERSAEHRPVLSDYSEELLDSFMVTLSAATITSYALYTFFETRAPGYAMMLTIPFVIYGVLRYQALVMREGGGQPEEVLLGDRPMIVCVSLWVLAAIGALYVVPLLAK